MTHTEIVITVISAVLGSGGIASAIVSFFSVRKYKAEAALIEQQAETAHEETEQKLNEYIRTQLKELSETHKKESEELREQNKELSERVNVLTRRINQMMLWIVGDNNAYRTWLESELRKLKPDIVFPRCKPAPGFASYESSDNNDSEIND